MNKRLDWLWYNSPKAECMATNGDYATKTDLKALREEVKGDMTVLRDELVEAIHDSETRLLKAFYDYAESNRLRIVTIETASKLWRSGSTSWKQK